MDISTLTLKLTIFLFPGLIAALLYRRLTVKNKERSDFMFVQRLKRPDDRTKEQLELSPKMVSQ